MLFALGAVSSALDAIQSLTSSKSSSTQQTGSSQSASTNPFAIDSDNSSTTSGATPSVNAGYYPQISPETMNALFAAQSQSASSTDSSTSSTSSSATSSTSMSQDDALKDLFSKLDANGDGQISKSEFENALGAGGTNLAQADDVFSKLDTNSDGSVSLDELSKALKGAGGHHGGHHHAHAASGSGDASGSSGDASGTGSDSSSSSSSGGSTTTTTTGADGSTTTTVSYADGFKMTTTVPGASNSSNGSGAGNTPYDWFAQMMQNQTQGSSGSAASSLSMSV
jgi:Ca2+-binding EF-hand superfamily protein